MRKRTRVLGLMLAIAIPLGYTTSAVAMTNSCASALHFLGYTPGASGGTPGTIGYALYGFIYDYFIANC
ncbi:MAG: hypothetical protein ABI411_12835 [Tahibacter sp.]